MRGINQVWISGNVGGKIINGKTNDGRSALSFSVAMENDRRKPTWVRVNVYDNLADYCADNLDKGVYCSVVGEFMNRKGQYADLTEVRAREVIFSQQYSTLDSDEENCKYEPESTIEA